MLSAANNLFDRHRFSYGAQDNRYKAQSVQANFEWTFVKIYAGDLYGVGEAGHAPGLVNMLPSFRELLVGEDALKIRRIEQKLRWATHYSGTTTYHFISAINIALYDLVGKFLNMPIWRLLGGGIGIRLGYT